MHLAEDVWLLTVEFARSWLWHIIVTQLKFGVVELYAEGTLQLAFHLSDLLLDLFGKSVLDNFDRHFLHAVNVDVNAIAASNGVRHFLNALTMHLVHVCLKRACRRELARAHFASEVAILLVLK